jgi:hypothetical protein
MSARGGAGNIQAAAQQKERASSDLEANRLPKESVTIVPLDTKREYAHSGRGGAGNYYSPKELDRKGDFGARNPAVNEPRDNEEHVGQTGNTGSAPVKVGRGGAGNFTFGKSDESDEENRQKEEEGKIVDIEKHVEDGVGQLQMPEKAKLAGGERDLKQDI